MKKILYLLAIFSLALLSCMSAKQKETVEKTTEMLDRIEVLKKLISSPEVKEFQTIYDTAAVYNSYFMTLPPNFERTDSIMDIIYHYGTVEKCFKKMYSKRLEPLLGELNKSEMQITNLKTDIENGLCEDTEIDNFIRTEDSILTDIENLVLDHLEFAKQHKEKFEKYHPMIVNIIKDYKVIYE